MEIKEILKLYKELTGSDPKKVEKLPGAGSSRQYYRLSDSEKLDKFKSVIATIGSNKAENKAFCFLSDFFKNTGIRVPEILKCGDECYLQTDHGSQALFDIIKEWQKAPEERETDLKRYLRKAIDELVKIQTSDRRVFAGPLMAGKMSERQVKWDLNYFKYNFLKVFGVEADEEKLEDDFDKMGREIVNNMPEELIGFMYRDFQSRNIMVQSGEVTLIDFQGGREGPFVYDIVSLLWQAKAAFPDSLRQEMLQYYTSKLAEKRGENVKKKVSEVLPGLLLFRTLQVLGAYGFRGLIERKAHFIESIAGGLNNLEGLLEKGILQPYPELERCCRRLVEGKGKYLPRKEKRLRVEIFSFSYKKGYPEDFTGNGGGFMFDCRGMHNPGRYEEFKRLTGRDQPVIEFLEERGEVAQFLEGARLMTEPAVATYLRRGFSNLQIGFGCTGGQHRSVYCAQHLAEYLAAKFPGAEIILFHREQGIKETFNSHNN